MQTDKIPSSRVPAHHRQITNIVGYQHIAERDQKSSIMVPAYGRQIKNCYQGTSSEQQIKNPLSWYQCIVYTIVKYLIIMVLAECNKI